MAASDSTPSPVKNVAFHLGVVILDNDGDPVISAAGLDSEISKDGGAFTDCTNECSEIGNGHYALDLTSTEMNADIVRISVKTSTTDAKTSNFVIPTQSAGKIKVDLETIKTQTVTCAGGVTVPAATLASTTNITAGTLTTVTTATNVTTVNGLAANAITAASINADAFTAAKFAADVGTEIGTAVWATTTRILTAGTNIGTVSANVISISDDIDAADALESILDGSGGNLTANLAGDVTGSVQGSVASVTGNVAVGSFASNAITAAAIATDAGTEIATAVWALATRTITGGTIGTITGLTISGLENMQTRWAGMTVLDGAVYQYTANALELAPSGGSSVQDIVDGIWDEATSGHATSGTFGAAVIAAGSAGDPWSTAQPGAYAAGTFGYLVSTTYTNLLTGLSITVSSPITADGGTITLRRGDDYLLAIGTQVPLVFTGLPYSLVGATMVLKRPNSDEWTCTVTGATTAYFERTNVQTTALIPNQAGETVEFNATLSGGQKVTPATATLVIRTEV
jgi:hypothetical protein